MIFSKFKLIDKINKILIEKIKEKFKLMSNHYNSMKNTFKSIKNRNFFITGCPNIYHSYLLAFVENKNKIFSYTHGNEALFPLHKTLESSEFIFSNFHITKSKAQNDHEKINRKTNSEFVSKIKLLIDKPNYYKEVIEEPNKIIYQKKTKNVLNGRFTISIYLSKHTTQINTIVYSLS